jgi:hypothetical protein
MRHVVHCSGYNLAERRSTQGTKNWEGKAIKGKFFDWNVVCLGDPDRGVLGRVPMTIRLAELLQPECLIWSTGATYESQISEAEIMMATAVDYLTNKNTPIDWLRSISIVEKQSTDTPTSMNRAAEVIQQRFGDDDLMLHLVTSQNHAPRVARDAAIAFDVYRNVIISVVPAHTSYAGQSASDVVIKELSPR